MSVLFTIGHSTHPIEVFVGLLKQHGITALADVRSHPYSRHFPQYSQEALKAALAREQIAYVFLGKELGARSENPACYRQGKVQYELLAQEPKFAVGLERLRTGMERFRIALMCAEKDPLDCHRAVLVARRVYEGIYHRFHQEERRTILHAPQAAQPGFFLREIDGIDYVRRPDLAPTKEILDEYKKNGGDWSAYERKFMELMARRRIEEKVPKELIDGGCLLCSEPTPEHCHRRLVAEYLRSRWGNLNIIHL